MLALFEILLRHPADAGAVEVGLLCLYASGAAQVFIALLLPLCDERRVGVVILQQPVVKLFAYCLASIVEVIYVS